MMASSVFYQRATAFCASRASSAIFHTASRVIGNTSSSFAEVGGYPQGFPQQQQQIRFKMTKAKRKRGIRWRKRQALVEKGKELQKPPGYMPIDTPVEDFVPREVMEEEIRLADERDKKELEERRALLMQETPLRHFMTGMAMSERVQKLFDMANGNQQEVVAYQKRSGMKLFEMREGDTGSTAVQIVALTSRIQQLQTHMRAHHKDKSTKRGLLVLTVRRRKLLDYLERKEFDMYRRVVKSLGLARK
ncbi:protein S15 [Seminavis robusta]|uniref:Protein S15 n=1 Tax=Seminavis robusta TaxID=568900 RepID=A0A9N8HWQ4_9STRA|nr:protein S15 [Seminavis robusta]|eukprot:Sro2276_g321660.1 protein S15 (248) ;mRNA; r:9813-10638